jgi:hypothetical protein
VPPVRVSGAVDLFHHQGCSAQPEPRRSLEIAGRCTSQRRISIAGIGAADVSAEHHILDNLGQRNKPR